MKELIPKIDREFRTEENNRSLLGHSFGGYFVLYSLLNQLENKTSEFSAFISASPTLWYNDFYLKRRLPKELNGNSENLNLFISVGSLEDSTWSIKPVIELSNTIEENDNKGIVFKNRIYNHLNHMDVGMLSFTKGLQELSINEE